MPLRPLSAFVGRDQEVTGLGSLLEDARAGEPRIALVVGDPGVGKSRLLTEALGPAGPRADGQVLVLRGRCNPVAGTGLPYAPLVSALRPVLSTDGSGRERGGTDPLQQWPALHALAPARPADSRETAAPGRLALFESVLALLRELSTEVTVALVLDDLHWADPSTADLVGYLASTLLHERLLVVLSMRPDVLRDDHPLRQPVTELELLGSCSRLDLGPLGRSALAELVASLTHEPPTDAALDVLALRSGGLPFFVEELLWSAPRQGGSTGLPTSVRQLLLSELAALGARTRQLLGVAATAGREVSVDLLATAAELSVDTVHELLQSAFRRQVLVPGTEPDTIMFRHDLYRETALADLLPGQQRRLHRRMAQALSAEPGLAASGRPSARLAYHHERAGDLRSALEASLEAAADARSRAAVGDTALHLEQALGLWDQVAEPEGIAGVGRGTLAREAAVCRWLLGDPPQAVRWGRVALDELGPEHDPDGYAAISAQQARYLFSCGQRAEALSLLRSAEHTSRGLSPGPGRAHALATLAQVEMLSNDCLQALRTSSAAADVAAASGLTVTHLHARSTRASVLEALGRVEEGARAFDQLLAEAAHELADHPQHTGLADEVDNPAIVLIRIIHNAAFGAVANGSPGRALVLAERGLEVVETHHLGDGYRSGLTGQRALALLALGEHATAREVLADLPRLPPSRMRASAIEAQIAWALMTGDDPAAAVHLEAAGGRDELLTPLPTMRVELALLRDRPDEAAALAVEVIGRMERSEIVEYGAHACFLGIEAQRRLFESARRDGSVERAERAAAAVEGLRAAAHRFHDRCHRLGGSVPPDTQAWVAMADAEAAWLPGQQGADAVAAWRGACQVISGTELRLLDVRARLGLGQALLAAGHRAEAATVLGETQVRAERAGAQVLERATVDLAYRGRLDLGRASETGQASIEDRLGLTEREVEVLRCLAEGLTNHEIGVRLFISPKTASVHVSNILRKLDVPNRRAAAARTRELGLFAQPSVG